MMDNNNQQQIETLRIEQWENNTTEQAIESKIYLSDMSFIQRTIEKDIRLSWKSYFMSLAFVVRKRSNCMKKA